MKTGIKKMWTKDDLREFLTLWDSRTLNELADHFGVSKSAISQIAASFRKQGLELQKKRLNGQMAFLIQEIIREQTGFAGRGRGRG